MSKRKIHRIGHSPYWPICNHNNGLMKLTQDNSLVTCKKCQKILIATRFSDYWDRRELTLADIQQIISDEFQPSGREKGVRLLNNWLSSYIKLTEETEPPPLFHLWTAITIVGAMMGRKCMVKLGPELFFPNLYTVLIGPPGVRKGTAIKYGSDILSEVQNITMAPDAVTKEQLIGEFETVKDEKNINGNMFIHSSLFIIAPELVVFIKENDHERLGYLCQLYDNLEKFEYKTKTSQNFYITKPGLWILGATTPNWIEIAMKQLGVGGGMTSRTIFVFASKKGRHIPVTKMKPFDPVLRSKLITDLGSIRQMAGQFTVTPEADNVYSEWYEGRYRETGIDDSRFASYWERYPSMVIKVAMIMAASKREDYTIYPSDIVNSIRVFEAIHPGMPHAFGAMGYNVLGSQTEMLRNLLRERKQLYRHEILRIMRMHISEWDYLRIKNTLIAERFCERGVCKEKGDEYLTCIEKADTENQTDSGVDTEIT